MNSTLLSLRRARKLRKPVFKIQDSNVMPQLSTSWTRPRGMHNKVRLGKKGHEVRPTVGYRSPAAVRGLDRAGFLPVRVHSASALTGLDPKVHSVIIGASVGGRQRLELYKLCQKANLPVSAVKDLRQVIVSLEEKFASRKKAKVDRLAVVQKKSAEKKDVEKKVDALPAEGISVDQPGKKKATVKKKVAKKKETGA